MGSTVLIVEDDMHTTELVRMYLARDGHKVLTAADGLEGLRVAGEARPDLVVLDLMLPDAAEKQVDSLLLHNFSGIAILQIKKRCRIRLPSYR